MASYTAELANSEQISYTNLLGRIAVLRMRPIVTDQVSCLSVYLSVCHSPAKTAEPIDWVVGSDEQHNDLYTGRW